jgi:hypothetical protein
MHQQPPPGTRSPQAKLPARDAGFYGGGGGPAGGSGSGCPSPTASPSRGAAPGSPGGGGGGGPPMELRLHASASFPLKGSPAMQSKRPKGPGDHHLLLLHDRKRVMQVGLGRQLGSRAAAMRSAQVS